MAGIARIVMARRERMILLEPLDKGLVGDACCATLTRSATRTPISTSIPDLKYPKEMKDLAGHIIETKAARLRSHRNSRIAMRRPSSS